MGMDTQVNKATESPGRGLSKIIQVMMQQLCAKLKAKHLFHKSEDCCIMSTRILKQSAEFECKLTILTQADAR